MSTMPNDDFARQVMHLVRPAEQFEPTAVYDPDGDCIEFLARPDPFYAERVDDLVTVYYSQETHEIVGSLIKGVSSFCKEMFAKFPGFRIEIRDNRLGLEHIFRARLWTSEAEPQDLMTLTYRRLIEVAEQADVDAELCPA